MIKKYCDKCNSEKSTVAITCPTNSLVDSINRTYVISTIDLCDKCRNEFREMIYNWLYNDFLNKGVEGFTKG